MISFQGRLYWRGDDGYEQERVGRVFNACRPARYPAAILKAACEEDVVAGVKLARERGWKVSVRAGGHSWAAWSLRDDALLIDLAGLQELSLDTSTGIVRVSPAVTGEQLNAVLAAHGYMFNGGHCPTVGLGGFLLQGGMGWNCRGWGWACERIAAIDVVTANGELIRADETQNADLLWAARGSGPGFFGVVTRFHLKARPLPRALLRSNYIYPMESFDGVMSWAYAMQPRLAPTVEFVVVGKTIPLPDRNVRGPFLIVHGLTFSETHEEAIEALAPLDTCPVIDTALVRDTLFPTTLAHEYEEQRSENPEGYRYAVDNAWIATSVDRAVPALREAFATLPTKESFSILFSMAPLRKLPDMALSLQSEFYFASYVIWKDAANDEASRAWLAEQMRRIEPFSAGLFLADADFTRRSAKFLSAAHWMRLEQIRTRYDPNRLFHTYLAEPGTPLNVNGWQAI
jgi:FAD/FMN-containing dehydrogenase